MRFVYAAVAVMVWGWVLYGSPIIELVSNDTLLLALSIVIAGGLAGGA